MDENDAGEWIGEARRFASEGLDQVRHALRGPQVNAARLFNGMRNTLHWAVECWLRRRGAEQSVAWPAREAHFLQMAPMELRDAYQQAINDITRLADTLQNMVGADRMDRVVISDARLSGLHQAILIWLGKADRLLVLLTKQE
jgi:hypothetical protein